MKSLFLTLLFPLVIRCTDDKKFTTPGGESLGKSFSSPPESSSEGRNSTTPSSDTNDEIKNYNVDHGSAENGKDTSQGAISGGPFKDTGDHEQSLGSKNDFSGNGIVGDNPQPSPLTTGANADIESETVLADQNSLDDKDSLSRPLIGSEDIPAGHLPQHEKSFAVDSNHVSADEGNNNTEGDILNDNRNTTPGNRQSERSDAGQASHGVSHTTSSPVLPSVPDLLESSFPAKNIQSVNTPDVTVARNAKPRVTFVERKAISSDSASAPSIAILISDPGKVTDDELKNIFLRPQSDRESPESAINLLLKVISSRLKKFVEECNDRLKDAQVDPKTKKIDYEKKYKAFENYILGFDAHKEMTILRRTRPNLRESELANIIRGTFEHHVSELSIEHAASIGFLVAYEGCLPLLQLLYKEFDRAESCFTLRTKARIGLEILRDLKDKVDVLILKLLIKESQFQRRYEEGVEALYIAVNQTYRSSLPKARVIYNKRGVVNLFKAAETDYIIEQVRNDGTKHLEFTLGFALSLLRESISQYLHENPNLVPDALIQTIANCLSELMISSPLDPPASAPTSNVTANDTETQLPNDVRKEQKLSPIDNKSTLAKQNPDPPSQGRIHVECEKLRPHQDSFLAQSFIFVFLLYICTTLNTLGGQNVI